MTRIASLALMIGALCGTAMSQQVAEFSSYYSGNRYDFRLTLKQLLNTPAWLEDEPNPPLSPRTAQSAALSYLRTLFDDASAWRLQEIKLVPLRERWVYIVSFTPPPPPNVADHLATPFSIVVTMDGNAVNAVMSLWKLQVPPASFCSSPRQRPHEHQISPTGDFVRFPIMCQDGIDTAKLSLPPEFRLGGMEPIGDTGVILRPQPEVLFDWFHNNSRQAH